MDNRSFPAVFLVVIIGMISVSATNYYVSTSGNDADGGSLVHPWRHIAFATCGGTPYCSCATSNTNKLAAGDTLFIRGGIYHEHNLFLSNSGTKANRIVIKSYPGEWATIDGDSADIIFHLGAHGVTNWITIDSLHLTRGWNYQINSGYEYADTGIVIKNCLIDNLRTFRLNDNPAAVAFDRNSFQDTIFNCKIVGNEMSYDHLHMVSGILLIHSGGCAIINCDISHGYEGIWYKLKSRNTAQTLIKNNFIHDNYVSGADITTDNFAFINNLVINNNEITESGQVGYDGVSIWNGGLGGGGLCRVEHNTIYGNKYGLDLGCNGIWDSLTVPPAHGSVQDTCLNNILWSLSGEMGAYALWPYSTSGQRDSEFVGNPQKDSSDYNLYYNTINTIRRNNTWYTLSDWRLLYPTYDAHSVQGQPTFANISGTLMTIGDFKLLSGNGYRAASDGTDMGANVDSVGLQGGQTSAISKSARAPRNVCPRSAASPYCSIVLADRRSSLVSGERIFDIRGRRLRQDQMRPDGIVISVTPR